MKIINYKRAGQLVADDGFDTGDMGSEPRREIFGLAGIAKAFNDPPDGCRLSRSRLTLKDDRLTYPSNIQQNFVVIGRWDERKFWNAFRPKHSFEK